MVVYGGILGHRRLSNLGFYFQTSIDPQITMWHEFLFICEDFNLYGLSTSHLTIETARKFELSHNW
jgi:hypothetical protein